MKELKVSDINWENVKSTKLVLLAETEEIAKSIVENCFKFGVFWDGDSESDAYTFWSVYKENTCYTIHKYIPMDICEEQDIEVCLYYCNLEYYVAEKYEILKITL